MGQNDHTVYPRAWMLYWGSLNGGYNFYGPFKSYQEAFKWSSEHLHVGTTSRIIEMADVRQDL